MQTDRHDENTVSATVNGIHVSFEHFAELAATRRRGEFDDAAASEFIQLHELFSNISFIADWEHRRHLHRSPFADAYGTFQGGMVVRFDPR